MQCRFKQKDFCALSSCATSQFCVENSNKSGIPICSVYNNELELESIKAVLKETQKELDKEREIKADIFNTLFSAHEVYLLKRKDRYEISLVINGEICSWEVDEKSVAEGAYSAIPIRKRNKRTSQL